MGSNGAHEPVLEEEPGTVVQSPKERQYRIFGPRDARRDRPPIVPLVDGIVMPNSLGVWVGAFGVGKTWALADMAVCMAMGKQWLHYPVKQGAILIIDEESGERRLSDRIKLSLDAHESPDDIPLHYTCFNSFNFFSDHDSAGELAWLIKSLGIQMVVIDALTDVCIPANENDAEEMGIVLKTLKMVTDMTGASIQLLHHENKAGMFRGSTNIPALVDVAISVKTKMPKSNVLDFAFIKARDVAQFEFSATINYQLDKVWLSPTATKERELMLSRPQKHVMSYLREHCRQASVRAICADPETCTEKSARGAVYELAGKKMIHRIDTGRQGEEAIYAITEA